MPASLALFITKYGYIAIFWLVFLQELGVPNPVPNELVLLFSGYLASINILTLPVLFITVVCADFVGTTILYFVFYFFESYLFRHKPSWLPISKEKIQKVADKISRRGKWGIYVGRLIPYVRGYTSVAAGLLRIPPRIFLPAVFVSAITWSGGYAIAGKLLGPYWERFAEKLGGIQNVLFMVGLIVLVIVISKYVSKKNNTHQTHL